METTEALGRRLETTRELGSVVSTMKALAAVNIRQFERAAQALEEYNRTVELGLRAALRRRPEFLAGARRAAGGGAVAMVVFGTDQGMCGPLNEQVADKAKAWLDNHRDAKAGDTAVLAVGERMRDRLAGLGLEAEQALTVPGSVSGITPAVQDVLWRLDAWQQDGRAQWVVIHHARQTGGASFTPVSRVVLPVDRQWLQELAGQGWPTRQLPAVGGDWDQLFSALVRQFVLVSLYRAFADSLASENASRLAAMQGAERNIEDRLSELTTAYNQARQQSITEELLDIAAGFEALTGG